MVPAPNPEASTLWLRRIFLGSLLLLGFGLLVHSLGDPDVYIHLRDGRYWVENHYRVNTDPFSYTAPDRPFDRIEAAFKIGLYRLYQAGGIRALILAKAAVMTAALFLLGWVVFQRWPHLGVVSLLLALGILIPWNRFVPERPFVFTYLLIPLFILVLEKYRLASGAEEPPARRLLWLLPALVIPWANLHPGFTAVFFYFAGYCLEQFWRWIRTRDALAGQKFRMLSASASLCLWAGAVNPMGISLYTYVLRHLGSSTFMQSITEWAPAKFTRVPLFFLTLGLVWLLQFFFWRKARLSTLVPLLVFSYLGVRSYRNIALFVIAGLPVLAELLRAAWMRWVPHEPLTGGLRRLGYFGGVLTALFLLVAAVREGYAFRIEELPHLYPAAGLAWLQRHGVQGRLLAHDRWGGYIGWTSHGQIPVFLDGRLEMFGEDLYHQYRGILFGREDQCLPLLDRYQVQAILVSPQNQMELFEQLWKTKNWALVYWDHVCVLYVRIHGPNRALAEKFAYRCVDPSRFPNFFNPQDPVRAGEELDRAMREAPDSYMTYFLGGIVRMLRRDLPGARADWNRVIELAPRHVETYYNLALIDFQENRFAEAENHLLKTLSFHPDGDLLLKASYLYALDLERNPKRREEALRWAHKALRLQPGYPPAEELARRLEAALDPGLPPM